MRLAVLALMAAALLAGSARAQIPEDRVWCQSQSCWCQSQGFKPGDEDFERCVVEHQVFPADGRRCEVLGFKPGTERFHRCVIALEERRAMWPPQREQWLPVWLIR